MNCVRKHLSAIKGGRLAAAAAPARVVSLIISDVPGDDPSVIASGPTVPDPTTLADARAMLQRYGIDAAAAVARHLADPANETPKPGDPAFARGRRTHHRRAAGCRWRRPRASPAKPAVAPLILGDSIEGEAREVRRVIAGIARQVARHGQPARRPACCISGGETTVTVRGKGAADAMSSFCSAWRSHCDGRAGVWALAGDTDGVDGSEDIAGAIVAPDTLARAAALGIDPRARLADNDAYRFFEALGDQVITGPTLTNVNDFRVMLVPRQAR